MSDERGHELEPSELPQQLQDLATRDAQLALGVSYVLQGHSYREAAKLAGYRHHTNLWHKGNAWVAVFNQQERTEAIGRATFALAMEALAQTGELLRDQKIPETQVPIVAGIMTDKAIKLRELELRQQALEQGHNSGLGAAAQLLAKLHEQGGGSISIEVSPQPSTIDVEHSE